MDRAQEWIEARLSEIKKSKAGLAAALSLHPARISEILGGRRQVKTSEIPGIARYLEMSDLEIVSKLTRNTVPAPQEKEEQETIRITPEERAILDLYRQLSPEMRDIVRKQIDVLPKQKPSSI